MTSLWVFASGLIVLGDVRIAPLTKSMPPVFSQDSGQFHFPTGHLHSAVLQMLATYHFPTWAPFSICKPASPGMFLTLVIESIQTFSQ